MDSTDEWLRRVRQEMASLQRMSCGELQGYLQQHWDTLLEGRQFFVTSIMADRGCREAVPFILRRLEESSPADRALAAQDLQKLKCRECRGALIRHHLTDRDDEVRAQALLSVSAIFYEEMDVEILRMSLAAFDDPTSSLSMRLRAAEAMLYQVRAPKELGSPVMWSDKEEHLQHPAMQWAVAETRRVLASQDVAG